MKLIDALAALSTVAPVALSDEFCKKYSMYDNSGIIVDAGEDIRGALFTLDLSERALKEAISNGYNLIVTHHPAIYGGIKRLNTVDDPQAKTLASCIKAGVSVISMHLNFDAAKNGIDYYLMRGLGGENGKILAGVEGGGYGRVYDIKECRFSVYAEDIRREFESDKILFYGGDKTIKRVASFCGAGCDDRAISFAIENGADAFASADMKHHEICALLNYGLNVIHMTHYASENYGFKKIYNDVKKVLKLPSGYYDDGVLS